MTINLILQSATKSVNPPVKAFSLGDGYEQTHSTAIADTEIWTVSTIPLDDDDANDLETALNALQGDTFTWIPPYGSSGDYRLNSRITRTMVGYRRSVLQFSLRKVKELGDPQDWGDPDNDGLTTSEELLIGTDPLNPDTDNDARPDGSDPNPLVPGFVRVKIGSNKTWRYGNLVNQPNWSETIPLQAPVSVVYQLRIGVTGVTAGVVDMHFITVTSATGVVSEAGVYANTPYMQYEYSGFPKVDSYSIVRTPV